MNASMADLLDDLLQGGTLDQISSRIGADPDRTRVAIKDALPVLLGGLERNAADPQGAESLQRALAEDQHASILDDLDAYLSGQRQDRATDGDGILDHILGDRRERAAQALGQQAGLSGGNIMQLLAMLAPLVMGMLGKKSSDGSTGGGFPDLGEILGQERSQAQQKAPDMGDILGQVFGSGSSGTASSGSKSRGGIVDAITDLFGRKD